VPQVLQLDLDVSVGLDVSWDEAASLHELELFWWESL
jgi:hypothetical protein